MKTLILYATKSGATRECAEILANKIPNCSIFDLSKNIPNIEEVDNLIIGSGVRMGHVYNPVKKFIANNIEEILDKNIAIYLCNAYPDTFLKTLGSDFAKILINKSICVESFGGKPPFSSPKNQDWIKMENINTMIQLINSIN